MTIIAPRLSRRLFMGTASVGAAALVGGLAAAQPAGGRQRAGNVQRRVLPLDPSHHPGQGRGLVREAGGGQDRLERGRLRRGDQHRRGRRQHRCRHRHRLAPTAAGLSQQIPYEVVALSDNIGPAEDLVVRTAAGIKTPADLKGKRVAVPFGSTSHFRLLGLLKETGLTQKDVTVLDLKPDAAVAAWIRGDIDAAYSWNPARSKMREAGGELLPTWKELDAKGYVKHRFRVRRRLRHCRFHR